MSVTSKLGPSEHVLRRHEIRARKVHELRRQGMTNRQIAEALSWSLAEVKMVIHRARKNGLWNVLERAA